MDKKKKVAIIGTNGIPAMYGGFETLSEFLVENLNEQFDFTVFCSKGQKSKLNGLKRYKGATLSYLPLNANGYQSILYDSLSVLISLFKYDTLLVLGSSGGFFFFLNTFFKKTIILNHGGLNEWEREKYGTLGKLWGYYTRKFTSKYTTHDIGDNPLIIESLKNTFGIQAKLIVYGGDHAFKVKPDDSLLSKYPFAQKSYFVSVLRAQPDNYVEMLIESFKNLPNEVLVIVSNWKVSDYGKAMVKQFRNKFKNIYLVDAIYDKRELNFVRSNAKVYIHSHSFCGTAPSLVEAMSLELPVISFDVPTNRYTTGNKAFYFKTSEELTTVLSSLNDVEIEKNKSEMIKLAKERYTWGSVSELYAELF